MPSDTIKINDMNFNMSVGRPTTFEGKHAGKELAGIDLDFSIRQQRLVEDLEKLFSSETVKVEDPFVGRSYEAILRKTTESYQSGYPDRHYTMQVRELDLPPIFDVLEIEGHQFPVLRYVETDPDPDEIGRYALLRLSREQFVELQKLIKKESVQIKRIGVDEDPLTVRYGGAMYWSKHKEDGEIYYKQIVRFFSLSDRTPKVYLASGFVQDNLIRIIEVFASRFEALVNELVQNNVISDEKRTSLLEDTWEELLDTPLSTETRWPLQRVSDAEKELD